MSWYLHETLSEKAFYAANTALQAQRNKNIKEK